MRWIIFFIVCITVASSKQTYKNGFGRILRTIADGLLNDNEDPWTRDDYDLDSSEEDDQWQRNHYTQKESRRHCTDCNRPRKFGSSEEDDNSDEVDWSQKQRKHNKGQRQPDPEEPCQPNFDLLKNMHQINAQLASKLYQQAKLNNDDKNIVVSPVSVQLALAAVNEGARGNTKRQINQLLEFGIPKNQNQNAYSALARSLKGHEPEESGRKTVEIKSTTTIILGPQQTARERFVEATKKCYGGEVKRCDFRHQPQQCRDQINNWIATKTDQKLQHVITADVLTANTKMISIGTMQLKASWSKQFRKNLKPVQGHFYPLGEQQPSAVEMLDTHGDFNYYEDSEMQVLGIQTQEKQLTMYITLPKQRHGLNRLEKQRFQYGKQLQQILDECDSNKQSIHIRIPVFRIAYKLDAKDALRKLGIEDAFDGDDADFGGIQETEGGEPVLKYGKRQTGGLEDVDVKKASKKYNHEHKLHLNKMIHLATIQVDEHGIDAANPQKSNKPKPTKSDTDHTGEDTEFKADHAFMFMIKHNPTDQLIFVGRIVDATLSVESERQE